ncbi:hypothetical protein PG984_002995 [Apiospora sp. TS-2023a]
MPALVFISKGKGSSGVVSPTATVNHTHTQQQHHAAHQDHRYYPAIGHQQHQHTSKGAPRRTTVVCRALLPPARMPWAQWGATLNV